jgi:predicted DNA-binding protein
MSLSLRLSTALESEIVAYSTRTGLSKSAVIVRSIEAFLRSHAQPSAFDLYEEAMRSVSSADQSGDLQDARPHKQAIQAAVRRKHADRSARALRTASAARKKAA